MSISRTIFRSAAGRCKTLRGTSFAHRPQFGASLTDVQGCEPEGGRGERSVSIPLAQLSRFAWLRHACAARHPQRRSSTSSPSSLNGCPAGPGDFSIRRGADADGAPARGDGPRPACLRELPHRLDACPPRSAPGLVLGAAALLAAAALLTVSTPAMAQEANAQLGNVTNTESVADGERELDKPYATGFNTGSPNFLHSVRLDIAKLAPNTTWRPLRVEIWTATSDGVPLERVGRLASPTTPAVGLNTFTAPRYLYLQSGSNYAVVVNRWDGGELATTSDDTLDDDTTGFSMTGTSSASEHEYPIGDWQESSGDVMRFEVRMQRRTVYSGRGTAESLSALTLRDSGGNATVSLSPAFSSTTNVYTASVGSNVSRISLMGTSTNALGRIGGNANNRAYRVIKYRAVSGGEFQDMEPCEAGAGLTDACRDLDFTVREGRQTFIIDVGWEVRDDTDGGKIVVDIDDEAQGQTLKNTYSLVVTRRAPLTAEFTNVPNSHDGSTAFTLRVKFPEDLDSDSQTRLASAISVTNGSVTTAPAGVGGSSSEYSVGITPSSAAPVRISLRGSRNCTSTHSLCSTSGSHMGSGPSVTVSTNTDAMLESLVLSTPLIEPENAKAFLQLEWSDSFDSTTYAYDVHSPVTGRLSVRATPNALGAKITLSGEGVETKSEFTGTAESAWSVPAAGSTLTVTVTSLGGTMTRTYTVNVTRPREGLQVFQANAYERPGAELQFKVSLIPAQAREVTVNYETVSGSALPNVDYTPKNGELTFAPGETTKWVNVAVLDDDHDEGLESMALQLSDAEGAEVLDGFAYGVISNSELTATFENLPGTHDGTSPFTFRIAFNQPTTITAEALRDHALTVSGGTVTAAEQVEGDTPGLWELTVQPSGTGNVSLVLPHERACTEPGAVCAEDDRPLSAAVSGTVTGTDGMSNTAPTGLPAISGTARVGETLTASADGIADADGLTNAAFAWQWIANDGASDANIADATDATYALTSAEEGKTVKVRVTFTDDAGTEETLVSDATAAVLAVEAPSAPLTAEFSSLPAEHDGSSVFTFALSFSEDPAGGMGYLQRLRDSAFEVSGGSVKKAERQTSGSNRDWTIRVQPDGDGAVTIVLPETTDCEAAGAICTSDGRKLSKSVSATVAGPPRDPLTASFGSVPSSHDGSSVFTFALSFSEDPAGGMGYLQRLRDSAFEVSGGRVKKAERQTSGSNRDWTIRVQPDGDGAVTIVLPETTDCEAAGAICTPDGRMQSRTVTRSVQGPPGLSVEDAEVQEAANASLSFTVTLDRTASGTVTVAYATSDVTAMAPEDYTPKEGTLSFDAGETQKTVTVAVLEDSHNDDGETLTLTLSNASGAYLRDATATGTIRNTDPMPKAWLARFGRAATDQAVESIARRMDGGRVDSHLTLGGGGFRRLRSWTSGLWSDHAADGTPDPSFAAQARWQRMNRPATAAAHGSLADGSPSHSGSAVSGLATGTGHSNGSGTSARLPGAARDPGLPGAALSGADPSGLDSFARVLGVPNLRDLVMGSSFLYTPASDMAAGPDWLGSWSAWGETGASRFSGADGTMNIEGDVATATFGFDSEWGRWLAGVALSYTEGDGAYSSPLAGSGGEIVSSLASLHPYARYKLNERTSVWGVLGYGVGDLTLTPSRAETGIGTDLSHSMVAFGGRTALSVRSAGAGQFELAVRSDARLTQTASDTVQGLVGAGGATGRVRVLLEGSGSLPLSGGRVLTPTLEAGLRYDGGDAETGAGLEIGAGLGYSTGRLSVQVNARGLVAHEDAAYEEWGFSGSVAYNPREDGLGLNLKLGSSWGATQSGVNELWTRETASGLAGYSPMDASQRFQAQFGYGLEGRMGRAVWLPFLGAESAAAGSQTLSLGVKLRSGTNVEAGIELAHRNNALGDPGQAIRIGGNVRW